MYCPSCGAEIATGLSFCNRCGANLTPTETTISVNRPQGLLIIIALGIIMLTGITIGGIAVVFAALMEFFKMGFPFPGIMTLAFLAILTIFGSVWVLSRLLSRVLNLYVEPGKSVEEIKKEKQTRKLAAKHSPELTTAPIQPLRSVTENTTRTLDPVYREQEN